MAVVDEEMAPPSGTEVATRWKNCEWLFSPLESRRGIDGFYPKELPSPPSTVATTTVFQTVNDLWVLSIHRTREEVGELLREFLDHPSPFVKQAASYLLDLNENRKTLPGNLTLQQMRDKLSGG